MFSFLVIANIKMFCILLEHGIHPPSSRANPWETHIPDDANHVFVAKHGVYHVYENEEEVTKGNDFKYDYPNLETFITDMNTMCNMIADGPL